MVKIGKSKMEKREKKGKIGENQNEQGKIEKIPGVEERSTGGGYVQRRWAGKSKTH